MTTDHIAPHPAETDPGQRPGRPRGGLKVEAYLFFSTAAFFAVSFVVYWYYSDDPAGMTALLLTGVMLAMIATFLMFSSRRLAQPRPEDDPEAEVADGAGDVGFFPPASYFPLALAGSAMLSAIAVAFWFAWLLIIGFGLLFLSLCGWLFEYQRAHDSDH